jgi:hypothetical protein
MNALTAAPRDRADNAAALRSSRMIMTTTREHFAGVGCFENHGVTELKMKDEKTSSEAPNEEVSTRETRMRRAATIAAAPRLPPAHGSYRGTGLRTPQPSNPHQDAMALSHPSQELSDGMSRSVKAGSEQRWRPPLAALGCRLDAERQRGHTTPETTAAGRPHHGQ